MGNEVSAEGRYWGASPWPMLPLQMYLKAGHPDMNLAELLGVLALHTCLLLQSL